MSRREHALQVAQPQESQHGVWRTYCDGSRVIPCKVTAHPMGCDDNRGEESMELLKAFKSSSLSRVKKKNLVSLFIC